MDINNNVKKRNEMSNNESKKIKNRITFRPTDEDIRLFNEHVKPKNPHMKLGAYAHDLFTASLREEKEKSTNCQS